MSKQNSELQEIKTNDTTETNLRFELDMLNISIESRGVMAQSRGPYGGLRRRGKILATVIMLIGVALIVALLVWRFK